MRAAAAGTSYLRVGVVGLGKMGRHHLQVLDDLPGCQVAGVADPSPAAAANVVTGRPEVRRCRGHLELLEEVRPDAVFVLVPIGETFRVTADCLRAGIPVLVEKPAGLYAWQTRELARLARAARVPVMVGLNRRYYASVLEGREALLSAGPVHSVAVEAHEDVPSVRAGGRFPDEVVGRWVVANGIHVLDLVRFFGGDTCRVTAVQRRDAGPLDYCAAALIDFDGGGVGRVLVDTGAPGGHRFDVRGAGLTLTSEPGLLTAVLRRGDGTARRLEPDLLDQRYKPGLWRQDQAFLHAVREGGRAPFPASDLDDAARTMELIERVCGLDPGAPA